MVAQNRIGYFNGTRNYSFISSIRSSRSQMFFRIGVLKIFCKFHRKAPVLESLFNKVAAGLQTSNFTVLILENKGMLGV